MKYNFDEVVDRIHEPGSYSIKWADNELIRQFIGAKDALPEDRISYFTADMDYRCAPGVKAALQVVLDHDIFGYSGPDKAYFEAVQGWFKRRFDWEFPLDSIFIAHGTHEGIADIIKRFTNEGDGVLLFTPSYGYTADVEPIGRKLVRIPMFEDNGYYTLDFAKLEEEAKKEENSMIILIQPHNPTGRVFTVEEITKIGEICRANNVLIVSDEVHIDLTRDGRKIEPVMKVLGPQGVIAATAVNKTFNVAGLAMSNMIVADPELKAKMPPVFGASPFGIAAVKGAYNDSEEWVDELNKYQDVLLHFAVDRLHEVLPKAKVSYPEATYVLWVDFAAYGLSNEELDDRLMNKARVLFGAGDWLDPLPGTQMRRLCITSTMEVLKDAMNRIEEVFKDLN